jgi:hypothetical protein
MQSAQGDENPASGQRSVLSGAGESAGGNGTEAAQPDNRDRISRILNSMGADRFGEFVIVRIRERIEHFSACNCGTSLELVPTGEQSAGDVGMHVPANVEHKAAGKTHDVGQKTVLNGAPDVRCSVCTLIVEHRPSGRDNA